ncbi:MAG: DUF445 domain-containing protein [Pelagimonas sp.]|nr:DUF445 domain-containing protein [Pelagimonas sp.]
MTLPAMRRAAMATLLVLVALYLVTFIPPEPGGMLRLLRAAAGAGIVGALADWFAVVALFRHPLGLPIPHTALLPRNQARVADNVGRFIEEHFLQAGPIAQKLRDSQLSARVAQWMLQSTHAEQIIRPVLAQVVAALRADLPADLDTHLADMFRVVARDLTQDAKTATELSEMLKQGFQGDTLTEIIGFLQDTVEENRDTVQMLVRDNSRWWIASRVDRNAADMIVTGLLSVLRELSDTDSELRQDFEKAAAGALDNVATRARLHQVITQSVGAYLDSAGFEDSVAELIQFLKARIADHLEQDSFVQSVLQAVRVAAEQVSEDSALQARIDAAVADIIARLIPELRPYAGAFIAQTIKAWDSDELVARFETEAGPDLQFIRINGALLGFVIGGGLFALEHAIG